MSTPYTLSSKYPRKELVGRLQKNIVSFIFIALLALSGLYFHIDMKLNEQNNQQKEIYAFLDVTYSAKEYWYELLLSEENGFVAEVGSSSEQLQQILISEYDSIEQGVLDFGLYSAVDVSGSLALLDELNLENQADFLLTQENKASIYEALAVLEELNNALLKVHLESGYQQKVFMEQLIWWMVAAFVLLALVAILSATDFVRQLRSGFAGVHCTLDHHKHGHAAIYPPRNLVDELTDLSHVIDNELVSKSYDLNDKEEYLSIVDAALSKVNDAFFITNKEGDITWLSAGAEGLWFKNITLFESVLGIDSGLDEAVGERVLDSILMQDEDLTLKLSDGMYGLKVQRLELEMDSESEKSNQSCIISIQPKSELSELQVLHHSLKLMEQDVWDVPVRVLRAESPYMTFSQSLEVVRQNVTTLFDSVENVCLHTKPFGKITKLQQIASLIDEKSNHNVMSNNDVVVTAEPSDKVEVGLNEIAWLSGQIRDSLILGYELVLQRLALVEKDLSSDAFLLADVDRCLNEVRSGVLYSLSATEGESEKVRRRFSVDLEHDISKVQNQIEGMKATLDSTLSLLGTDRSVGLARLDRARESVNEIIEKLHELITKMPANALEDESYRLSNDYDDL
ncbi:hypothetical protein ABFY09_01725 [Marinomonas sp. 5E14-1]|uniref:hypothetical protein n=1 Tax=Marinomonas sp. 5E14-1 TaxID=3153922 RepID=UPI0032643C8B